VGLGHGATAPDYPTRNPKGVPSAMPCCGASIAARCVKTSFILSTLSYLDFDWGRARGASEVTEQIMSR